MKSSPTISSPIHAPDDSAQGLDLGVLPPIFVSATRFESDELHQLEDELSEAKALLTYDVNEARIVLSKVTMKPRIQFDLRAKGVWTEEVPLEDNHHSPHRVVKKQKVQSPPGTKAIVVDDSSTDSENDTLNHTRRCHHEPSSEANSINLSTMILSPEMQQDNQFIDVIRTEWFETCKAAGRLVPLKDYISYRGRRIDKPEPACTPKQEISASNKQPSSKRSPPNKAILERAKEDSPSPNKTRVDRFGKRKFNVSSKPNTDASWAAGHGSSKPEKLKLLHMTTSENEDGYSSDLPEMPEWVRQGIKYACQRSTPRSNPNEVFIGLLEKIKLARILTNDEIGVRAYSTSIASLRAYPHHLRSPREILALPGCDTKIANLFVEWMNTGHVKAVEDIEADEDLQVLRLFYDIWGVGATTAREFYYERGWKELDDIVEYGWSTLSRVQQIGVKYYEEFQDLIPKAEVEEIGRIIYRHAVKVRDESVQSLIVGGYRRGKEASGDVDVIVSHPDEHQTLNIVNDIVTSLEDEGWITHTLLLSLNSTNRGQQTLPFRTGGGGHGFDTLDKALVVWQDPSWPTKDAELAADPKAKNPNIHRRVDIIVSPWRTVGCAVTGWSGGTTFQRDLRRYAKYAKGWKFDSSGVRSRMNGEVVDVEGWSDYKGQIGEGRAKTMVEAERRVFEGLGLVYREPWDRCTG